MQEIFSRKLLGAKARASVGRGGLERRPDWEWHSAAEGGLEQLSRRAWPDGRAPSLRRLLIDLIEEYARHVGHADLIRESVDGLTGEDPPGERVPYPGR